MQMVGGGKMHVYPPEDEGPHKHGVEPNWQESVVLVWWDLKQSVGGYLRIGHEPNHNGGEAVIWTNFITPEHVFHRACEVPLKPEDLIEHGFSADQGALRFHFDGRCHWTVREDGIDAALDLEDFHPAVDGYLKDGTSQVGGVGAHHVEVACRVTGTVNIKGQRFDVDGLGIRDRGWGVRDWASVRVHRWTVGVFDRDNSFCALTVLTSNDKLVKFGWVIRGDKVIYADKVDTVAYVAADGCTNRGGRTLMVLSTGERFEVHLEPLAPGLLSNHHTLACSDTLCRVRWGDKIGIGDFESTHNGHDGVRRLAVLDGGIVADGWHPNSLRE
jgi:hypothetical protein